MSKFCTDGFLPKKDFGALEDAWDNIPQPQVVSKPADNVNHPSHYTQAGIECIDAIAAATSGKTGIEAVCVANVIKYLWRYELKNGVEDVKKARWYIDRLISEMEKANDDEMR
ncbi:DUF3310 domain-containing protein [Serratia ficaria]|uniref:DUF3310 domain-containing protein n=1 Tax=Serratia ficaria TaxID=61651 RepID=UPI0021781A96|nr:DUF3310 domain-containing protein [Serratia ficaria]CAI1022252.1 Protein of unknwon function (DUF3310) [Serratia ficaria]CAI1991307.1 Protein of unknwon function (DUF3310) [Serratia ficaria]